MSQKLLATILYPIIKRFVAGVNIEQAVGHVKILNKNNIYATLDILGENVTSKEQAVKCADDYIMVLETIAKEKLLANVSLKLTMMGLDIGEDFCYDNVKRVIEKAAQFNNFVRIDMEGSPYTEITLNIFRKLYKDYKNVGIVLQAYLYRTLQDIQQLNKLGATIRLCKGAYKEPSTVAYSDKSEVNKNYKLLTKELLTKGTYPAIASHDEEMIKHTIDIANEYKIPNDRYEFQMLYGIRRNRAKKLASSGHKMRVYVPFGSHCLPYFFRRIRERKENLFFILKHLFSD